MKFTFARVFSPAAQYPAPDCRSEAVSLSGHSCPDPYHRAVTHQPARGAGVAIPATTSEG